MLYIPTQSVDINNVKSICLNYIEQNKSLDGESVSISYNQLHIGPDMIECLKKTGYLPPMHGNEFTALVDDLLKQHAAGISAAANLDKWK
jgi:hypothetical protein